MALILKQLRKAEKTKKQGQNIQCLRSDSNKEGQFQNNGVQPEQDQDEKNHSCHS